MKDRKGEKSGQWLQRDEQSLLSEVEGGRTGCNLDAFWCWVNKKIG